MSYEMPKKIMVKDIPNASGFEVVFVDEPELVCEESLDIGSYHDIYELSAEEKKYILSDPVLKNKILSFSNSCFKSNSCEIYASDSYPRDGFTVIEKPKIGTEAIIFLLLAGAAVTGTSIYLILRPPPNSNIFDPGASLREMTYGLTDHSFFGFGNEFMLRSNLHQAISTQLMDNNQWFRELEPAGMRSSYVTTLTDVLKDPSFIVKTGLDKNGTISAKHLSELFKTKFGDELSFKNSLDLRLYREYFEKTVYDFVVDSTATDLRISSQEARSFLQENPDLYREWRECAVSQFGAKGFSLRSSLADFVETSVKPFIMKARENLARRLGRRNTGGSRDSAGKDEGRSVRRGLK